jgi:hypothetical protein
MRPASILTPIKNIGDTGPHHANPNDSKQDEEERIATQSVDQHKACAEDQTDNESGHVENGDAEANDLDDEHPEADEQQTDQPGQSLTIASSAEEEPQRKPRGEQEKNTGPEKIGRHVDQAEIRTLHIRLID